MFLDMNNSTTIAERLGHEKYYQLLQEYYELMSDEIIAWLGEVYQYIGDEVVVTWLARKGTINNNCLACFDAIKKRVLDKASYFETTFGCVPKFKAGIHIGYVTTGELGALKKEIVYTVDVLNTTARIQAMCKAHDTDLIVTERLLQALQDPADSSFQYLGEFPLRGKEELVRLYAVQS